MWFNRYKHSKVTKEIILASFPSVLSEDVLVSLQHLERSKHEIHFDQAYSAFTSHQPVQIPYRVYFPSIKPQVINKLSPMQQAIVASIMSRHHDGFQREIWIKELMLYPYPWTLPFIVYSLGDYVIEVVAAIEDYLTEEWIELFKDFTGSNYIDSYSLSQRILSYWDIYYRFQDRRYKWLKDYPKSLSNKAQDDLLLTP